LGDFTNATLERSSPGEHLRGKKQLMATANYKRGLFLGIVFFAGDFADCDFSGMNLTGSNFARCDLNNANFEDAVISNVEFATHGHKWKEESSKGLTVEQIKSTWNYRNGRMDGVVLPKSIVDKL
jgi:uncharacterized protein YjbI with pentapeptide repeats